MTVEVTLGDDAGRCQDVRTRPRLRCAPMAGAIAANGDTLTRDHDGRLDRLRVDWPEIVDRLEAAAALVDWDRPDVGSRCPCRRSVRERELRGVELDIPVDGILAVALLEPADRPRHRRPGDVRRGHGRASRGAWRRVPAIAGLPWVGRAPPAPDCVPPLDWPGCAPTTSPRRPHRCRERPSSCRTRR